MKAGLRAFSAVIVLLSLASFACSFSVPRTVRPPSSPDAAPTAEQTRPVPTASATPRVINEPRVKNGMRIVYVDGQGNLWLWDEGQKPLLLAATQDVEKVRLSPDGERIVFTRSLDRIRESIWVIQANGDGGKILMDELMVYNASPVRDAFAVVPFQIRWIAGTRQLAVSTWPIYDGLRTQFNKDLFILDAESGEVRQVFEQGEAGLFFLSPDGKRVALAHEGRIDLADVDGKNLRRGVLEFEANYRRIPFLPLPVWAEDSSRLRVSVPPNQDGGGMVIWEVRSDGSHPVRVGEIDGEALYSAIFSPDLERIAYLRKTGGDAPDAFLDLWIVRADGSEGVKKETGQLVLMNWAPGSNQFVYGVGNPPRPMIGRPAGEGIPLSDTRMAEQIRWVDAERLIFMVRHEDSWEIRLSKAGGESQVLISIPKGKHHPTYEFAP